MIKSVSDVSNWWRSGAGSLEDNIVSDTVRTFTLELVRHVCKSNIEMSNSLVESSE